MEVACDFSLSLNPGHLVKVATPTRIELVSHP